MFVSSAAWGITLEHFRDEENPEYEIGIIYAYKAKTGLSADTACQGNGETLLLEAYLEKKRPLSFGKDTMNRDMCFDYNDLQYRGWGIGGGNVPSGRRYSNIIYDDPACKMQLIYRGALGEYPMVARATPECGYLFNCEDNKVYNYNNRADEYEKNPESDLAKNFANNCLPVPVEE